jgi:tetratricopeptide (TPR) repeat protein
LRKLGNTLSADQALDEIFALDPLDIGARWQKGIAPANGQECLDLAYDLMRAGLYAEASNVLQAADLNARDGSVPMILFTHAYVEDRLAKSTVSQTLDHAAKSSVEYCFPSRLEEMVILEWAITKASERWIPSYLLGNLLHDKRRYEEAILHWQNAAEENSSLAVVHRNLGIAYFNVRQDRDRALGSFETAFAVNRQDARVLYERDQLWKRTGRPPQERLIELLQYPPLINARDDLSVEVATLLNQVSRPDEALQVLLSRRFQPWEGGEGLVLGQYVRARLLLGRRALDHGDIAEARDQFLAALQPPPNLSEAKHLLANQSDIHYWIGESFHRCSDDENARAWWLRSAQQKGDFQQMCVRVVSDMTFWTGLALQRLDRQDEATALFTRIYDYSFELENMQCRIDYFATSLPAMLLFNEDLARRKRIEALFLRAQALAGMRRAEEAQGLLHETLVIDSSHAGASDLLQQLCGIDHTGPVH